MAATAKETERRASISVESMPGRELGWVALASDGEHFEPRAMLDNAYEANDADDGKGNGRQALRKLVHG
jgi:hypothetical protein